MKHVYKIKAKNEDGFTFIEVLVAMLIMSIAITPWMISLSNVIKDDARIQRKTTLAFLAEERMEDVKSRSLEYFAGPFGGGFNVTSWTAISGYPGFKYKVFDDYYVGSEIKKIIVTVWYDENGNGNDEENEKLELCTKIAWRG